MQTIATALTTCVRWLCQLAGSPLPTYGTSEHLDELRARFAYVFTPIQGDFYYKPVLQPHDVSGPFRVGDIDVLPFQQDHGPRRTRLTTRTELVRTRTGVKRHINPVGP